MAKWMLRRGRTAKRNRRSFRNKQPYGRNPRQSKPSKRKQRAVQVNKSTSSDEAPSTITFQEQPLYGSFSGHGHGPDLTTVLPGFSPAYKTRTTCNKCSILTHEMKSRPRSYEELFHMAANNTMQKNANELEVQTHQDSRSQRQELHQGNGTKCSACLVLGLNDIHDYSHFPGRFNRSTISGFETPLGRCSQFGRQSIVDSYESLFERPLQSTYCRMCVDRGIYNCQVT